MKVITAGKSNHTDYVDVKKAEKLTAYAGKSRQERDLTPCGQKQRSKQQPISSLCHVGKFKKSAWQIFFGLRIYCAMSRSKNILGG